jgi:hypothetical protein
VAEAFEANAGLPLPANALIENAHWKGYRINPAVLILAAEAIAPTGEGHDSKHARSHLGSFTSTKATN